MKIDPFEDFPLSYQDARRIECYRAICVRVVDGDTYDFIVDLGITVRVRIRVRLRNFDTPEIFHPSGQAEKDAGIAAFDFIAKVMLNRACLVRTYRTSSGADLATVGRYVADVSTWDEIALMFKDIVPMLGANGFAKKENYA